MSGFDVNRFVTGRQTAWKRLEQLLLQAERLGLRGLSLDAARELGRLYRQVSSDLIRARTEAAGAHTIDYLNDIVARTYLVIHGRRPPPTGRVVPFLMAGFPRIVRHEWRAMLLSATVFVGGALVGAVYVGLDPHAVGALLPEAHQAHTPTERVASEAEHGGQIERDAAAAFSGFLFTHNIQVTFLVFALGITYGVGTLALLFYNGVPLGALAMEYHRVDQDLFFWAWILPHGIPELTVIMIAGAAGLIVARGLWVPGRRTRQRAVIAEARRAAALIMGGMPLLVLAGIIEGTISQMHAPAIAYSTKLAFAASIFALVYGYLVLSGRGPNQKMSSPPSSERSSLLSSENSSPPLPSSDSRPS